MPLISSINFVIFVAFVVNYSLPDFAVLCVFAAVIPRFGYDFASRFFADNSPNPFRQFDAAPNL
jgi:hypothetical protein